MGRLPTYKFPLALSTEVFDYIAISRQGGEHNFNEARRLLKPADFSLN